MSWSRSNREDITHGISLCNNVNHAVVSTVQVATGDVLPNNSKLVGIDFAVFGVETTSGVLVDDKLGIHEEFELMRHGKLRARCLDIFPNPPHVTCLTAIGSEDARFIRRHIIINPRTELVPNKSEVICRLNLW